MLLTGHMGITHQVVRALGHAIKNVHAGRDKLAARRVARSIEPRLSVTTRAFARQGRLPVSSTVEGAGVPPAIEWGPVPAQTRSIVVVCEDPDSPFPEPFVHWLVYGIAPSQQTLDRTSTDCKFGKNSKLETRFTPAAPPPGHGVHHYHFQVFALDVATELPAGLGRGALIDHMRGHVLEWGEVVGTYERG